jgi:hypothetical protein
MGNPVYTWLEGCSCQATLVYEGTKSKASQKTYYSLMLPESNTGLQRVNPSGRTMALESTQPLREMSTRDILLGTKAAGAYVWQPYHLHMLSRNSRTLKLLEPWRPVQASNGITKYQTNAVLRVQIEAQVYHKGFTVCSSTGLENIWVLNKDGSNTKKQTTRLGSGTILNVCKDKGQILVRGEWC